MESETTGPFFSQDQQTLFLSVQHPGEVRGTRKDMASELRKFAMRTTDGKEFMQTRKVPIGSNWPTLKPTFSRLFRTKDNNCGRKRQETAKLDSVYQRV